ncbi:Uncharacterized protein LHYA1_G007764 [Lachnellula hyalina]|uniref:Uncharacterized protein n=1 Tax=Lachnellula hyalina TaxID=1316788 RepID=A0A8H8QXJ6_9HELO|nr:Uncharacterized protein LHYA1_G007764 [Lachnellula hyalina]TVY23194.1 Uncharacterized protein LHYA1_G007764 [Lachnellula hyalina]
MRLFLLPISTRRTLIYCERLNVTTTNEQTNVALRWVDKGSIKAASLWASWEQKESGWQKWLVNRGNAALRRIAYEEWGLKSIPALSTRRKAEELKEKGKHIVEVSFPPSLIPEETVTELLKKLGTERQGLHQRSLYWCFIGMPIAAPFGLVPIAYSHWKALSGSKHLQFLVDNGLVTPKPSKILDELYSTGKLSFDTPSVSTTEKSSMDSNYLEEKMILHKSDGKRIAEALELPELDMELDRAVWQVERALKTEKEKKEKKDVDLANSEAQKKK